LADGENKYPVCEHKIILENYPNKHLMVIGG